MYSRIKLKVSRVVGRKWIKSARSVKKLGFNLGLNPHTWLQRGIILRQAQQALLNSASIELDRRYESSPDPLVRQGWLLKTQVERAFRDRCISESWCRILIQVPDPSFSPAGFSLFTNFAESFEFLGVAVRILGWGEEIKPVLAEFQPSVFLASDHPAYLDKVDWSALTSYRQTHAMLLGLTASIEAYGSSPLETRLAWGDRNNVDFYFSYRDPNYVSSRPDYKPFFDRGYPMLYLPFGANILHYYPVPGFQRDLDYALIATRKREHIDYLITISRRYRGFIDGPGWTHVRDFSFHRERDRYIYARAKIGLNVHQPDQLEYACELNERTYQLAACGVPQLTDHAKLLDKLFPEKFFFVADNPKQYTQLFKDMISNYESATARALKAQQEVFDKHTTFHRAYSFIQQLQRLIIPLVAKG